MTAQQYFNAHKGERMHGYEGHGGVLCGYHETESGFSRLIISIDSQFGWTVQFDGDYIDDEFCVEPIDGACKFMYIPVPNA